MNPIPQTLADEPMRLAEILDLAAAAPLREALLARRGGPVEIDGSQVQRLGGLCLQVLLSGQAAWAADGAAFRITAPSAALTEGLCTLGAAASLQPALEENDR